MSVMGADWATLALEGTGIPLSETVRIKGTIGVIGLTQSLRQRDTRPLDVLVEHSHSQLEFLSRAGLESVFSSFVGVAVGEVEEGEEEAGG